jgi:hypothetical protein
MRLQIKVKPRSRESSLEPLPDGTWLARLVAPPVDGKANDELLALVARRFGRPISAVTLRRGAAGRVKWVEIDEG